jgi:hypothetical protein
MQRATFGPSKTQALQAGNSSPRSPHRRRPAHPSIPLASPALFPASPAKTTQPPSPATRSAPMAHPSPAHPLRPRPHLPRRFGPGTNRMVTGAGQDGKKGAGPGHGALPTFPRATPGAAARPVQRRAGRRSWTRARQARRRPRQAGGCRRTSWSFWKRKLRRSFRCGGATPSSSFPMTRTNGDSPAAARRAAVCGSTAARAAGARTPDAEYSVIIGCLGVSHGPIWCRPGLNHTARRLRPGIAPRPRLSSRPPPLTLGQAVLLAAAQRAPAAAGGVWGTRTDPQRVGSLLSA